MINDQHISISIPINKIHIWTSKHSFTFLWAQYCYKYYNKHKLINLWKPQTKEIASFPTLVTWLMLHNMKKFPFTKSKSFRSMKNTKNSFLPAATILHKYYQKFLFSRVSPAIDLPLRFPRSFNNLAWFTWPPSRSGCMTNVQILPLAKVTSFFWKKYEK